MGHIYMCNGSTYNHRTYKMYVIETYQQKSNKHWEGGMVKINLENEINDRIRNKKLRIKSGAGCDEEDELLVGGLALS